MQISPDEPEIPGVVGRRSARLSIIVPVTVHGTDAAGQSFKENTWTISVNKHGGRIATFHRLVVDEQIIIENPLVGRTAKARVNRICDKRFAEDPYEVCVELQEPQNVWGVKLPPEDWVREQDAVLEEEKRSDTQFAHQDRETPAAPAAERGQAKTTSAAPPGSPLELGEHTGGLSQFNMAVNALSRIAGQAGAPATQPATPRWEPLEAANAPSGHAPGTDRLAFKTLQQKIDEAQSLKQDLNLLLDRVQSARGEVENLLLKTHEAQRDGTIEAEQAARQIEEVAGKKLQSALSQLDQEIERELGSTAARLAVEKEQHMQTVAAQILKSVTGELGNSLSRLAQETFSKAALDFQAQSKLAAEQAKVEFDEVARAAATAAEAQVRKAIEEVLPSLSTRFEEFKADIERACSTSEEAVRQNLEGVRQEIQNETLNAGVQARKACKEESGTAAKAISVCVDSAVDLLNRASDEAAAKLHATRHTVELSVKHTEEEFLPRLAGEASTVLEKFCVEASAQATQLQSQMESTVSEYSERAGREISDRLEARVDGALEVVARDINKQAEDSLELLKGGFKAAQGQCVEETEKQLAALGQSALNMLESDAGAKSATLLENLRATLLEMEAQQTRETEMRSQASLQSHLELLQTRSQLAQEGCFEEIEKQLAAARQSTLNSLEGEAEAKSASVLEQFRSTLVEMQAQQTAEMETGIQDRLQGIEESLQARTQLMKDQYVEDIEKQLAAVRQSNLSSLESEAEAKSATLLEQLRATLLDMQAQQTKEMETATQSGLQRLVESLQAEIRLTADEATAHLTAEIRNCADQALKEIPERLYKGVGMAALVAKEWEEQAKTHLEAHSRRLVEVFAKQLEALNEAARERQRNDAEAIKSSLRSRLDQAARLFEGLAPGNIQAEDSAGEMAGDSPTEPPPPPEVGSLPIVELPVEEHRPSVEEALGDFRSKLNQIITG